MVDTPSKQLRIAIVGGGIGGLTLAVAFSRFMHEELSSKKLRVDIYESTSKLTQIGAGISLWPRGWEVIRALGLEEALKTKLSPGQSVSEEMALAMSFRKSDQKEGTPIADMMIRGGSLSFHRADVQEALLSSILSSDAITFHLSHRLNSYEETPKHVQMDFANGTTATCDVLVGADGINSVVRRIFMENDRESKGMNGNESELSATERENLSRPVWTGTYVSRSLIDSEVIRKISPNHRALTGPVIYCGKKKHVVCYPVLQGKLLNTIPCISTPEKEGTLFDGPTVVDATNDDYVPHFSGWEDEVRVLVENIGKPTKWAIQTVRPLDKFAAGHVALLGDAAHAMAPHLGNGAGQAIEDAYILAHLIARNLRKESVDIQKILGVYNTVRQPVVDFVRSGSRSMGHMYEFIGSDFETYAEGDKVSEERIEALGTAIRGGWDWTWKTSAKDDLDRALALL